MRLIESLREAHKLWKTDSAGDTILAVVTLLAVFGPMLYRYYQLRQTER